MTDETLMETIRSKDLDIIMLMAERTAMAQEIGAEGIRELDGQTSGLYANEGSAAGLDPAFCSQVADALNAMSVKDASVPGAEPMRVAVVGGAGKMGAWTGNLLRSCGHEITVIDPASGNGLTLDDCADADAVVVSVPIHATDGVLKALDGICREDALIFDLTSLKSPLTATLRDMAGRRQVCSVHPMFGPSARSMSGRNLIVCDCGNREAAERTAALFAGHGGNIRVMDIEQHDEYMSYVLGLSHAVNIAFFTVLDRSGISFRDMQSVASTTFRKNLDTNTSVALEDPMLYYEIQHLNQHREGMWKLFCDAVRDLKAASLDSDPAKFVELMENGRRYFSE